MTEVNCLVYNWENMTCRWDLGVEFVAPHTIDIELVWTTRYVCSFDLMLYVPVNIFSVMLESFHQLNQYETEDNESDLVRDTTQYLW